jgi:hypothetical protein
MTQKKITRRAFLKSGVVGAAVGSLPLSGPAQTTNPIVLENAKPGNSNWGLSNPALNREIEGYAGSTSLNKGSSLRVFVSTAEPTFTYEVYRLGWYGGLGGRLMKKSTAVVGGLQVAPTPAPITGLVQCNWWESFRLATGTSWVSGLYLIKLISLSGKQSYVRFVLRDDARVAAQLFQSSVTTDQAYNNWGGKSTYGYNSTNGIGAYKVSFDRPYSTASLGTGELFRWEFQMMRFLEREGFDVKYCTNIDTHTTVAQFSTTKAFLSVGHDEYWSNEMRDNVETARNTGKHLGFFSANSAYWQIRLEPNSKTAISNRTLVCYKFDYAFDPLYGVDNPRVTTRWRDFPVNRPEESLIGVMFGWYPVNADFVISDESHWLMAGTGLRNGDRLQGLVGYECDEIQGFGPANIVRVAHSPVSDGVGSGYSDMTIYKATSGSLVFATGTMQWCWGLDDGNSSTDPALVHPAAQQITRNLLVRFAL